ncbi:hypothetical protein ACOI1H_16085 [Loktanella sp. DJP18]|uniref:hypothetical protein n=1 Tax=Loktanella sp. DJP18 TaxID=3409788 RepID=UPI003BB7E5B6
MPQTTYVKENDGSTYTAHLDLSGITNETMTDSGHRVGELEPIRAATLSPGDEPPVGRTPYGDLTYPVFKDRGKLGISRRELLLLAHLRFAYSSLRELPSYPLQTPEEVAVSDVFHAAVPHQLFNRRSNHGKMAYLACLDAVIEGNIDEALSYFQDEARENPDTGV